ncbi:histone-lysine N-methyltransferase SUV39H2 isoform X1 [Megalopta genalis]|uniref:histone-lysine N-methyltransferase SUV39H2 isoform X1 n=1 Tax=Megalopta genalis TaxID=115081 RepID=UPI003FCF2B12
MYLTREKRSASPGNNQPCVKQAKYEQKYNFSSADVDTSETVDNYLNNGDANINKAVKNKNNRRGSIRYSENKNGTKIETTRLKKFNTNNSVNFTDKNSNSIERLQLKYNLDNFKLKELRVILKDIKYDKQNGINVTHSENDVWEVENILGKKELNGQLAYLIKWKNWSNKYNSWEPEPNLINCSDILEEFEKRRLELLNHLQKTVNFYPNRQDIEQFVRKLTYGKKTIMSLSVRYDILSNALKSLKYATSDSKFEFIKDGILRMLVFELRKKQLESLLLWGKEMNTVTKGRPTIKVENFVDLEEGPQNFYYIDVYRPGTGVIIPNDPPIGCECTTCNSKAKCCFGQYGTYCPYNSSFKIRVPPGTPIYECNKRCACDINCINRVVQRGTAMKLCIFRTANGRGWGVKSLQLIKKGSFVTQYVGEVISSEEAEKRGEEYDAAGRTYLFDLDYNETEGQCPYTVDAAVYGNVSHFINHSCDPNLAVYAVWIDCLDPNLPNLALFATRDIKTNEEITFDYTCQTSRNSETSIRQDISNKDNLNTGTTKDSQNELEIRPDTPQSDLSYTKTLCKCGAKNCRRYLF